MDYRPAEPRATSTTSHSFVDISDPSAQTGCIGTDWLHRHRQAASAQTGWTATDRPHRHRPAASAQTGCIGTDRPDRPRQAASAQTDRIGPDGLHPHRPAASAQTGCIGADRLHRHRVDHIGTHPAKTGRCGLPHTRPAVTVATPSDGTSLLMSSRDRLPQQTSCGHSLSPARRLRTQAVSRHMA